MIVLGRYIDQHAQHVVITRQGDVVRHTRFTKLADADAFVRQVKINNRPASPGRLTGLRQSSKDVD